MEYWCALPGCLDQGPGRMRVSVYAPRAQFSASSAEDQL